MLYFLASSCPPTPGLSSPLRMSSGVVAVVTVSSLVTILFYNTARSAEVEPPGLGSKCGKRVERLR